MLPGRKLLASIQMQSGWPYITLGAQDVFGRPASGIDQAPARRQIIWRNEVFWAEIEPIQPHATLPAFRFAGIRQQIRPPYIYLAEVATRDIGKSSDGDRGCQNV